MPVRSRAERKKTIVRAKVRDAWTRIRGAWTMVQQTTTTTTTTTTNNTLSHTYTHTVTHTTTTTCFRFPSFPVGFGKSFGLNHFRPSCRPDGRWVIYIYIYVGQRLRGLWRPVGARGFLARPMSRGRPPRCKLRKS